MRFLVTGCAGFIGFHVAHDLLEQGHKVVGVDSVNDYYSIALKRARLAVLDSLERRQCWRFIKADLADEDAVKSLFDTEAFEVVIHLAAQPGVRYSIDNPRAYIDSNIVGFFNVLQSCRTGQVPRLIYASSSSVYGDSARPPFREEDQVDKPISLYAATKKSNELMAHAYSHLFKLNTTGLRFFTVYGPWGRPDMAVYLFADAIRTGKPLVLYREGTLLRDFTYISDISQGVCRIASRPLTGGEPYEILNIGNHTPVTVNELVSTLELYLGKKANKVCAPMQPGDVHATCADISKLEKMVHFTPSTSLNEGIRRFVSWYKEFHNC